MSFEVNRELSVEKDNWSYEDEGLGFSSVPTIYDYVTKGNPTGRAVGARTGSRGGTNV